VGGEGQTGSNPNKEVDNIKQGGTKKKERTRLLLRATRGKEGKNGNFTLPKSSRTCGEEKVNSGRGGATRTHLDRRRNAETWWEDSIKTVELKGDGFSLIQDTLRKKEKRSSSTSGRSGRGKGRPLPIAVN